MKHYRHTCSGTCSSAIDFDIADDDTVHNVLFTGGCNGNLQGIARLVEGRPRAEIISLLNGVSCSGGPTSCPDQLAKALQAVAH